MTAPAPAVAGERKPRCRMINRLQNRCGNEVIDPDPAAPQFCAKHALEAAQLLADYGAIKIKFTDITRRDHG